MHKEARHAQSPVTRARHRLRSSWATGKKSLIRSTTDIMNRHHRIASIAIGLLVSTGATALDVNVVGLFPNKAVVQIEGGALQTLSDLHHGLVWEQADDVHVQRGCAGRDQ